jgi:Flp pilus assembly protein TadD
LTSAQDRCGNGTLDQDRPAILCNYAQFMTDKRHDRDRAESLYLRALSLEPTSADTLVRYAVFLEVNGEFQAAERLLRQATGINQSHAMGLLNLAVLFETVKHDYANAEWYYKSAYQVCLAVSCVLVA